MTEERDTPGGGAEHTERRLTPTERYHELAMQVANRQPTVPEHAIELTRNSKGDVQIALTVRGGDLAELERDATVTFDQLCEKYPRADTAAS